MESQLPLFESNSPAGVFHISTRTHVTVTQDERGRLVRAERTSRLSLRWVAGRMVMAHRYVETQRGGR